MNKKYKVGFDYNGLSIGIEKIKSAKELIKNIEETVIGTYKSQMYNKTYNVTVAGFVNQLSEHFCYMARLHKRPGIDNAVQEKSLFAILLAIAIQYAIIYNKDIGEVVGVAVAKGYYNYSGLSGTFINSVGKFNVDAFKYNNNINSIDWKRVLLWAAKNPIRYVGGMEDIKTYRQKNITTGGNDGTGSGTGAGNDPLAELGGSTTMILIFVLILVLAIN